MTLAATKELKTGAVLYVGSESGIKVKYHAASVNPVFTDAPTLTRDDGIFSFTSGTGTKARCSITPVATNNGACHVYFSSVETFEA